MVSQQGAYRVDTLYLMYKTTCIGEVSEYDGGASVDDREYKIKIYWDVWERVGSPLIPGINTDLCKEVYDRDFLPYLLSVKCPLYERSPEYKPPLLAQVGMSQYDGDNYFGYIKRLRGINPNYDAFYYSEDPNDIIEKDIDEITNDDLKEFVDAYNRRVKR